MSTVIGITLAAFGLSRLALWVIGLGLAVKVGGLAYLARRVLVPTPV